MPAEYKCNCRVLRYAPDPVKGEFVNIGLVFREDRGSEPPRISVRFTDDWRRVRCVDPGFDEMMLREIEGDLTSVLENVVDADYLLGKLDNYLSASLEFSPALAILTEDPQLEIEALAERYLQTPQMSRRERSARMVIHGQMREAFQAAGVWQLMRKQIAAAEYTHKGDPLKIDCGYRPNGVIKLFQAVSLESDANAAKVLAFSYPALREGIQRVENAGTALTAIVEDDLDRNDEKVLFALNTLHGSGIRVALTSTLTELAETARLELRV